MTAAAPPAVAPPGRLARLLHGGLTLVIGPLLCLSPLTAILVLGWQTRRMAARIDARLGQGGAHPGWLLGPRHRGLVVRLLGGLAANIRAGVLAGLGLALLTLPVTVLWLGAWWAGWDNSFNKGYEQAAVGPSVWFAATLLSLPIFAHLPLALAHAAAERRFAALFELRRIRSLARAAGWRLVWLAVLSVGLSLPLLGLRVLPVFVEGIVPGFAEMTSLEQGRVAANFDLLAAAVVFLVTLILRDRAAAIYAIAAPRAARGRSRADWDGHRAAAVAPRGQEPPRIRAAVWLGLSLVIWAGLPVLIVLGQFMNYAPHLWLTHPVFLLPWAG